MVAFPADEADLERVLDWCADVDAAAIPFGGGTSVVGGVEPRVPQAAAVTIDLADSTACSGSTPCRARLASRPAPPVPGWRSSSRPTG